MSTVYGSRTCEKCTGLIRMAVGTPRSDLTSGLIFQQLAYLYYCRKGKYWYALPFNWFREGSRALSLGQGSLYQNGWIDHPREENINYIDKILTKHEHYDTI